MGVGAGLYMYDVVVKSSRSLSHFLMSSCFTLLSNHINSFDIVVVSGLCCLQTNSAQLVAGRNLPHCTASQCSVPRCPVLRIRLSVLQFQRTPSHTRCTRSIDFDSDRNDISSTSQVNK